MILVTGPDDERKAVASRLSELRAELSAVAPEQVEGMSEEMAPAATVVVDLSPALTLHRRLRPVTRNLQGPVFLVVADTLSPARTRALYADGVAGVINWPRESLVLPRLLAEMLSLRWARGRAAGPDPALRRVVRAHLRLVPSIAEQPRIDVGQGIVTVSGTIDNLPAKLDVEACIEGVPGVLGLDSEGLTVDPEPVSDRFIRSACRRLVSNALPELVAAVRFTVESGAVVLRGPAEHRRELQHLRKLATMIRGVRSVALEIDSSKRAVQHNRTIGRRIRQLLADLAHEDGVRVSVYDGVAVLAGEVPTLRRKRAVTEIVGQEPGVHAVVDKIVVSPPEGAGSD